MAVVAPPTKRPRLKYQRADPRQTDEVSKSAELKLQTEPDNENPVDAPSASAANKATLPPSKDGCRLALTATKAPATTTRATANG